LFSKLKSQLPPTGLLAAGLVIITLLTMLSGLWHYNRELASQPAIKLTAGVSRPAALAANKNPGLAAASGASGSVTSSAPGKSSSAAASGSRATTSRGTAQSGSTAAASSANNQPPGSPAQSTPISVALSVNGSAKGQVALASGSNQCDVLSQALAEGLISSLTMRYNSYLKTQGVYVIDGIGDPENIRWTYTVNGADPHFGCSLVTAHNADSVSWQY
jgi:hypothetical protein